MGLVDGVGCWAWVPGPAAGRDRPGLFLDRDGVVVTEVDYLSRSEDVELVPGAAETIARFNDAAIPVILVTNQSGVARGYYSWRDFEEVQQEITRQLSVAGARLDAVFACGYHADGLGGLGVGDHPWRKPNPGMLLAAAEPMGLRLDSSWIVGDRAIDLETGRAAGLAGGLHVMTGHADEAERKAARALASPAFQVEVGAELGTGAHLLNQMISRVRC
jgi:D-glycero-D-manno-heptose 1,7-bisphosphate phosphatase